MSDGHEDLDQRGGQYVELGDLDVSEHSQGVGLPCGCTGRYFGKCQPDPLAKVEITGVSPFCKLPHPHSFTNIGQIKCMPTLTRVWVAPDAPLRPA